MFLDPENVDPEATEVEFFDIPAEREGVEEGHELLEADSETEDSRGREVLWDF